ncbi:hypothetical protein [Micromonospora sp. NPDC007230]|uniref:hypothetical protein n=1 Tax=Micromonospora sp. NPDC007230 TaxID=3364237 RepID=UPI00369D7722
MDVEIVLGRLDDVGGDPLESLVAELAALFGVQFHDVTKGHRTFFAYVPPVDGPTREAALRYGVGAAGTEEFEVSVTYWPRDDEQPLSHPFHLDLTTEKLREAEVGEQVYQKLADTGRYRVALMLDDHCLRSSHVPCEDW